MRGGSCRACLCGLGGWEWEKMLCGMGRVKLNPPHTSPLPSLTHIYVAITKWIGKSIYDTNYICYHIAFPTTPSFSCPMAEMSVTNTTASLQSFPKSPLCSLSTTKFNSPYHPSAIVSPIPRFCLITKYNSFCFSAAVVKAASSSHANTKDPMLPPYNVLITGGSKG